MPLPAPAVSRERMHVREVTYVGYSRVDGLFDIEATLVDRKDTDYPLASGVRVAGDDLHNIAVRVTIDGDLTITAVVASHDAQPYPGFCETITPNYDALVGLNLADQFRKRVSERMGAERGCTHLNEMLHWLPSAAFQSLAANGRRTAPDGPQKPFQLDRCHALVSHGAAVKTFYPKWYRPVAPSVAGALI